MGSNPFALLDENEEAPQEQTEVKKDAKKAPAAKGAKGPKVVAQDNTFAKKDTRRQVPQGRSNKDRADREKLDKQTNPADNRGKRVFDRRSGTGRAPTENKKGGAGRHNWGRAGEEVAEAETAEGTPADEEEDTPEQEEEEAAPELSLEEYLAKKQASRPEPKKNLRRAGEGVDQTAWANTAVLKVKEEEEEEGANYVSENRQRRQKKNSVPLDKVFKTAPRGDRYDDGGRGGRGGGRGRGGRDGAPRGGRDGAPRGGRDGAPRGGRDGAPRGGRDGAPRGGRDGAPRGGGRGAAGAGRGSDRGGRGAGSKVPNVNDTNAFPSLGGK